MIITVNGEKSHLKNEMTIQEFLKIAEVKMQEMVSVELNGEILDREDFETTTLKENDVVELLYFMGGGGLGI